MLNFTLNRSAFSRQPDFAKGSLLEVLTHMQDLRDCYPDFEHWVTQKVVPGIHAGERSILIAYRENQLAGFAITKDDGLEKKLCCLRVLKNFQKSHGIGIQLFERAFDELHTDKPLLSVAEERYPDFIRIFDYFGFQKAAVYKGIYRPMKYEYAFNGLLTSHTRERARYLGLSQNYLAEQRT